MLAWLLHDVAGPESYTLAEIPTPDPGPGEVRVALRTSALNHLDLWVARGMPAPRHFPHIAGGDGAGVVDAVGEGVVTVIPGNEVVVNPSLSCGSCPACLRGENVLCARFGILGEHRWGTLAEAVVVPAHNVVARPTGLSWEEAGSYALVAGTAYRMLRRARLRPGDVLLVVGIGGGVATAALSLGRVMGASVYVTSTDPAKIERARTLGAVDGFDSSGQFARELQTAAGRGADVVVESVGPATWGQSMRALAPGGRITVCGSTTGPKVELPMGPLFFKQLEVIGSTMFDHGEFEAVTSLVGSGAASVPVDSVFPFDQLPTALERLDRGDQLGKIVLRR